MQGYGKATLSSPACHRHGIQAVRYVSDRSAGAYVHAATGLARVEIYGMSRGNVRIQGEACMASRLVRNVHPLRGQTTNRSEAIDHILPIIPCYPIILMVFLHPLERACRTGRATPEDGETKCGPNGEVLYRSQGRCDGMVVHINLHTARP